jgi:transcription elongation factor Elf1
VPLTDSDFTCPICGTTYVVITLVRLCMEKHAKEADSES